MNGPALEAAAQAMCDRVNGQGDYGENIGQRRTGWLAQARAGVAAYLAALDTPKPPAGGDAIPAGMSAVMGRILGHYSEDPGTLARIKGMVAQYREAPFRSADWLAGEIMRILDSEPANDTTSKPPAGGDAETKGWDHRYRPLAWGEVILDTDECRQDDGTWVPGICVGGKAPDPAYTSHRVYRRLVAHAGGDAGAVERAYRQGQIDMRDRAAVVCDERGAEEQESYGLNRAAQNYFRARNAVRALEPAALALPAPVVEGGVAEIDDADIITFVGRFFDPTDNGYGADTRKWIRAVRAALSEGRSHG